MSSNFGQIPPLTTELAALERLKNRCIMLSAFIFNWILFILASNEDNHKNSHEFEIPPVPLQTAGTMELAALERLEKSPYIYNGGNNTFFLFGFSSFLQVTSFNSMHNSLNEFEFWPYHTTDFGVSCPWVSEKLMHNVMATHSSAFILAGY